MAYVLAFYFVAVDGTAVDRRVIATGLSYEQCQADRAALEPALLFGMVVCETEV